MNFAAAFGALLLGCLLGGEVANADNCEWAAVVGGKTVASFYLGNLAVDPSQLNPDEMIGHKALEKAGDGASQRNYT